MTQATRKRAIATGNRQSLHRVEGIRQKSLLEDKVETQEFMASSWFNAVIAIINREFKQYAEDYNFSTLTVKKVGIVGFTQRELTRADADYICSLLKDVDGYDRNLVELFAIEHTFKHLY